MNGSESAVGSRAEEAQLAESIWNRPSPRKMAIPCIFDETAELRELYEEEAQYGLLDDPINERFARIGDVLDDRLGIRYPECPACGSELEADHEGIVECRECRDFCDLDDATIAEIETEYERQRKRKWGWQGHGHQQTEGVAA